MKTTTGLQTPSTAPGVRAPAFRAVRVGVLSTVLVAGYWVAVNSWLARASCEARQTAPYPCLGAAFVAVLGGVPLLVFAVSLLLSGRGVLHSVAGGLVSVVLGTAAVYAFLGLVDFAGPDVVGWAMTAPAVGLVAAVWAVTAPGRTAAGSQS